jgi:hypothetical protein
VNRWARNANRVASVAIYGSSSVEHVCGTLFRRSRFMAHGSRY